MKKILTVLLLIIAAVLLSSCAVLDYSNAINTVKNGCLGGCIDTTVGNVFSTVLEGRWSSGEKTGEKIIVQYQAKHDDINIQFTVEDENTFKISSISGEYTEPKTDEEASLMIANWYALYYSNQYPGRALSEHIPDEPVENFLKGIGEEYAKRAKNPVEISNYLDKPSVNLTSILGLKRTDDSYIDDGIVITYENTKNRIETVLLDGTRIFTLFGINTHMDIDTAVSKISDRYELMGEVDRANDNSGMAFKRNNSSDGLLIEYNVNTNFIVRVSYMTDMWDSASKDSVQEAGSDDIMNAVNRFIDSRSNSANVAVAIIDNKTGTAYNSIAADARFTAWGFYLPIYLGLCDKYPQSFTDNRGRIMSSDPGTSNNAANQAIDAMGGLASMTSYLSDRYGANVTGYGRYFGAPSTNGDNYTCAREAAIFLKTLNDRNEYGRLTYHPENFGITAPAGANLYAQIGTENNSVRNNLNLFGIVKGATSDYCVVILTQNGSSANSFISDLLAVIHTKMEGLH